MLAAVSMNRLRSDGSHPLIIGVWLCAKVNGHQASTKNEDIFLCSGLFILC